MAQSAAVLWHVARCAPPELRGAALGGVGLCRFVPVLLLSLWGGVLADRLDRKRIVLRTQTFQALLAAGLGVATLTGHASVGLLYGASALLGASGAFDLPARQALLPRLVPPADLPNALTLGTIMFQIAAVLGPSLGGVLLAVSDDVSGPAWVYFLNAASFLASIGAVLAMRASGAAEPGSGAKPVRGDLLTGLRFVFSAPLLRSTMLLDFIAQLFAAATSLLPMYCQDVLHAGPVVYGWLYAAPSIGAIPAGAFMAWAIDRIERRGVVLLAAVGVFAAATVGFGLSTTVVGCFAALFVCGASDTVSMVLRQVVRNLETPDALRGRMTSVNMIFFQGGPQLGELEAGLVAQRLGAPFSVISGGVGCLVATLALAAGSPALRRHRRAPRP